jgi:hypothetical protein
MHAHTHTQTYTHTSHIKSPAREVQNILRKYSKFQTKVSAKFLYQYVNVIVNTREIIGYVQE